MQDKVYGRVGIDIREGAGGPRFRVRWSDAAGRHSRTFPTIHEAQAHLAEIEVQKHRGIYQSPTEVTVGDVLEDHITRSADRVQPSTIRAWRQYERDHVPAVLKRRRVVEVRTHDWQRWADSLSTKGLAPASVQPIATMMSGALTGAVRLGVIERNTMAGVRLPTVRQKPMVVWTAAQAGRMLACVADDPKWHLVYLLMLYTGMRPGELRALQWGDFRGGVVHVRRTVARRADHGVTVRDGTKRGKGRHVALAAPVLDALERWRSVAAPGPYLWGEAPLPHTTWHRHHQRLCEAAGVPHITLHEIRHSYATIQLENGAHPKVISEVLGHSKIQITLDLYSHVSVSMQQAAAEMMARSLMGVEHDNTGRNQT